MNIQIYCGFLKLFLRSIIQTRNYSIMQIEREFVQFLISNKTYFPYVILNHTCPSMNVRIYSLEFHAELVRTI